MKKIAIILFNLGGPDGSEAVKPFLLNLFSDPAIIRLPLLPRSIIAKLIAWRRTPVAIGIYDKIGGRSPILENVKAQATALEKSLSDCGDVKCFAAMRYWHPFAEETIRDVKKFSPDEIVLLPLYPQFSTTTSASSLKSWFDAAQKEKFDRPTKIICCYPDEKGFIQATVRLIRNFYAAAEKYGKPRLLFSAHGLPEKIVQAGDPYQFQCEQTVTAIIKELDIAAIDYVLCYQSRVGPMKWLGPETSEEIKRAGKDKVPILLVPITFTCENSETLYETDILYKQEAVDAGVPHYGRVPTVSIEPEFIEGLANLTRAALKDHRRCISGHGSPICPPDFSGCFCRGRI